MVITMALKVGHSMYRRLIPGKTMPLHISQHIHDCIEFHKATLPSKNDGHGSSAEQRLATGKSPWSEPSLHVHVGMQQSSSTYLLASHASHAGRRWSLHVVCLGCCRWVTPTHHYYQVGIIYLSPVCCPLCVKGAILALIPRGWW